MILLACVFLGLTIWSWTTKQRALSWRKSPFLISAFLSNFFFCGAEAHGLLPLNRMI